MKIKSADFVISNTDYRKCPATGKPECAFIGRSNVGKSSLINFLLDRKKLAQTSSTPGKTRTINHFLVNDAFYLVDLPGYGYASRARTARAAWRRSTWQYLEHRETLVLLFVLVDASITPQQADLAFVDKLGAAGIPFSVVFTKADKAKSTAVRRHVEAFRQAMLENWETLPPFLVTSTVSRTGRQEVLDGIGDAVKAFAAGKAP